MSTEAPDQASRRRAGIKDYTCGLCGEEFGSNLDLGDIKCTNCEARLCPCCGAWFNEDGDSSQEPHVAPDLAAASADLESEIRNSITAHCGGPRVPCVLCLRETDRAMVAVEAYARLVAEHERTREPQSAPELDDTRKRAEAAERELAQLADSLGASVRAARDAERKRIRELADRNGAVCTGDEGTSFYFSALLADKPGEVPDA